MNHERVVPWKFAEMLDAPTLDLRHAMEFQPVPYAFWVAFCGHYDIDPIPILQHWPRAKRKKRKKRRT
jgi:hypothetical protein